MELDRIDRAILKALQENARLTNVELGAEVGLSASACSRRVQALEGAGVLCGYHALVNERALGFGLIAIVHISLEGQSDEHLSAFEKAVVACPNIWACDLLSGASDYILRVGAKDLDDFGRVHREVLSTLPGVVRIESSFSLKQVANRLAQVV